MQLLGVSECGQFYHCVAVGYFGLDSEDLTKTTNIYPFRMATVVDVDHTRGLVEVNWWERVVTNESKTRWVDELKSKQPIRVVTDQKKLEEDRIKYSKCFAHPHRLHCAEAGLKVADWVSITALNIYNIVVQLYVKQLNLFLHFEYATLCIILCMSIMYMSVRL